MKELEEEEGEEATAEGVDALGGVPAAAAAAAAFLLVSKKTTSVMV